MGAIASQITGHTIVYSTVYSDSDRKTSKLRVTGLCAVNSPVTGEFSAQMASNAENVSIWWRHHDMMSREVYLFTFAEHLLLVVLMVWVQVYNETVINNLLSNLCKYKL